MPRSLPRRIIVFFGITLFVSTLVSGQSWRAETGWYKAGQPYIKLYFASSTVAEVNVSDLVPVGFPVGVVPDSLVHVYERGVEIPLEIEKRRTGNLQAGDRIRWVTRRNSAQDERWAYHLETNTMLSSGTRSMYSDTVVYWLTWDNKPGLRYKPVLNNGKSPFHTGFRDTVYLEKDSTGFYFEGTETLREISSYTESEGVYWRNLRLGGSTTLFHTIEQQNLTNLLWRFRDSLITFDARFHAVSAGATTAAKRAHLEVFRDLPDGSGAGFVSVANQEWNTATARNVRGSIRPTVLRDTSRLTMRLRVENRSTNISGVNDVYFDWIRYSYYRGFFVPANLIRWGFRLRHDGVNSVRLTRFQPTDTVRIFIPETRQLFVMTPNPADSSISFDAGNPTTHPVQHIMVRNRNYSRPIRTVRHVLQQNLFDPTNDPDYIIVTRPMFVDEARRYADYRGQQNGYSTMIVTMEEIWELFDHANRRPIALKRFLHYAATRWNKAPRFVFLVGDAVDPFFGQQLEPHHVPSFGIPPSDDWYVQNWAGPTDFRTQLSVGRLTVRTPAELRQYLAKVRAYERQVEALPWRKRVVMLSGGNSNTERLQLLNFNRNFARLAAASPLAADTILVAKTSNDPLGLAPRQDLKEILDDGVLLLHFFGHSAPNSWDLLTDQPATFGNVGRPNIVLSLGCYSGRFTASSSRIISEEFVFAPNASVAYIGGSGAGQIPALQRYGSYFYQTLFNEEVQILGDLTRRTKRRHFELNQTATIDIALMQNSLLLGDPALRLVTPDRPELLYASQPFTIRPVPTNVADSTMRVRIDVLNYGRRPNSPVPIRLEQVRPDNTRVEYFQNVPPIGNAAFTEVPIPLRSADVGVHQLRAVIDPDATIDEVSRSNNTFQALHQVFSTSADIIYPNDFGIHTSRTPRMVVSSPTFSQGVRIELQLDSTRQFQNPIRTELRQSTQLAFIWQPELRLDQGQNYWWRVRILDPAGAPVTDWRHATFIVDTTATGIWWAQNGRNYPDNNFSPTLTLRENQQLAFAPVQLKISTSTSDYQWGIANVSNFPASTRINGVEFGRLVLSFHVLALDGRRGRILIDRQYALHGGQYGSGIDVNLLLQTTTNQFIADMAALKEGDYVISRVRFAPTVFPQLGLFQDTRILAAWSSIGAFKAGNGVNGNQASQLDAGNGYILFGKKGARSANETSEYIQRSYGMITRDTTLIFNAPDGDMLAPLAGPARRWQQLQYQTQLPNFTSEASIEVYGYQDLNAQPMLLLKTDRFATGNRTVSLSGIDARVFPFLQLKAVLADSSRAATPQMPRWRIQYEPVPEVALDPFSVVIPRDTLQEGSLYRLTINVNNLSMITADTVFVDYSSRLNGGPFEIVDRDTIVSMPGASTRSVSTVLSTLNRVGSHELLVSVRTAQPDQYVYNNFFTTRFLVVPDKVAPTMEVFLNNRTAQPVSSLITNPNDPNLPLVSTEPVIEIRWRDDNELFLLNDPSFLQLKFNGETLAIDDPRITFQPATNIKDNRAIAFFRPKLDATRDSIYTLTIFARDAASNTAEKIEGYTIQFRVTSSLSIPSLYPYPNPMSRFTWFAFQLMAPHVMEVEQLRISIFTLNGKPVRVIDLMGNDAGLADGGLKVGWNRVLWDGRDQDGAMLANGVYLYKVDFKAGGKNIPVNNSKSVEKLVIIR